MKTKRIVSLILCLMLLVSTVTCVYAKTDAQNDSRFDNRCSFLKSLGVEAACFDSANQGVTRSRFTAMAMSLMPVSSTDEISDAYIDVDSSTEYAGAIAAAQKNGIISVGFDRRFNPQNVITYNEAIKITVAALGYSQLADVWGGYPHGYLRVAASLDIDIVSDGGEVSASDACDIIYSAFFAPVLIVEGITGGEVTYTRDSSRNVLTEYYHLHEVRGLVTSAGHSSLRSNYLFQSGIMEINGRSYKCDISDVGAYTGYEVSAWLDSDKHIKCIEKSQSSVTHIIKADDISDYSDLTLYVWNGQKEKKFSVDPGYAFVRNGSAMDAKKEDFLIADGELVLIDNNGDNRYDVIKSAEVKYLFVNNTDAEGRIYDINRASFANGSFITCNEGLEYYCDISVYDEDSGTITSGKLSDIAVNTVLSVRENEDGTYSEVTLSDVNINGTVEEISEESLTIGGVSYIKTDYFKTYYPSVTAGDNGTFFVSADGKLVGYSKTADSSMKYAYLMDVNVNSGMEQSIMIKVLESSGNISVYPLAQKIRLDDKTYDLSDDTVKNALINKDSGYARYGLIKYSTSKDGVIIAIDTPDKAFDGSSPEDVFSASRSAQSSFRQYMDKEKFWYKYYAKTAVGNFNFGSTIIFRVPQGIAENPECKFNDNFFKVADISYMKDDHRCIADSFDYNADYQPAAIVLYDISGGGTGSVVEEIPGHYAPTWLVDEVSDSVNPDGEYTTKLTLYNGTTYKEKYISSDLNSKYISEGKIPGPGDIVRICEVSDDIISGLLIDVDYNPSDKSLKINYTNSGMSKELHAYLTYMKGTAFSATAGSFALRADEIPSIGSFINVPYQNLFVFKSSDNSAACFDTTTDRAVPSYVKDIAGSLVSETNAERVVVKMSSGTFQTVFIYK